MIYHSVSMDKKYFILLLVAHVSILCLSNVLVQYPFDLAGFKTTWGALSYPLIFILSDLTVRLTQAAVARRIIYLAMLPGLVGSYLISNVLTYHTLFATNTMALRIAFASFCAYVVGQLSDIMLFQRLRQKTQWWVAPTFSTTWGNVLDTYCFFFIAFFHSSNVFLSQHWLEIASVDLVFKLLISLVSFIPLYGLILRWILHSQGRGRKAAAA
ncbi:membrane protein [Legionella erythra]|uniref:Probable queuosine precursor transporter n=2 Tax=Legionella erythra TaxID=448 RepID=A0A0W0TSZ6_LEGER|nr:membrane protein [Legionella erythra]